MSRTLYHNIVAIAVILGGLLAANLHGVIFICSHPATCKVGSGGLVGAAPALFAGGACCAPSLILLLGIPGLGAISAFSGNPSGVGPPSFEEAQVNVPDESGIVIELRQPPF